MTFRPELIDELLKDYRTPEDLLGLPGATAQKTTLSRPVFWTKSSDCL